MTPNHPRPSARERLLAAADELFYAEGIQTVGIDRVIDRAGVAKASLYRSFDNKDALVAAYLGARHERNLTRLNEALSAKTTPEAKLEEVFVVQAQWLSAEDYRGCPFTRASAEAPAGSRTRAAIDAYRQDIRELLDAEAKRVAAGEPSALVRQLEILFHGAAVLVTPQSRQDVARSTHAAAIALISASASRPG